MWKFFFAGKSNGADRAAAPAHITTPEEQAARKLRIARERAEHPIPAQLRPEQADILRQFDGIIAGKARTQREEKRLGRRLSAAEIERASMAAQAEVDARYRDREDRA